MEMAIQIIKTTLVVLLIILTVAIWVYVGVTCAPLLNDSGLANDMSETEAATHIREIGLFPFLWGVLRALFKISLVFAYFGGFIYIPVLMGVGCIRVGDYMIDLRNRNKVSRTAKPINNKSEEYIKRADELLKTDPELRPYYNKKENNS